MRARPAVVPHLHLALLPLAAIHRDVCLQLSLLEGRSSRQHLSDIVTGSDIV
jgi:hypothetical protein